MYLYYLLTVLKFELRSVKHYITSLQMLQFISGFVWLACYYNKYQHTREEILTICLFTVYNISLFILFGKFIKDTYVMPAQKKLS